MANCQHKSLADASEDLRVRAAFLLCVGLSLFQLYTAGVALLQTPVQRSIHMGFVLSIIFLLYPLKGGRAAVWTDNLCILCSVIGTGYIALFADDIAMRGGKVLSYEIFLGCVTMGMVLEAGRRVLGKTLPVLGGLFLLYCLYGRYAPSLFAHRGYSLERVVQHMYLTTEGIFGVALGVSSTFIFMFILFGAFLSRGGGARLFNNLAVALTGRMPGGPAKVAIVASGLLGTINGSSIANVATTGAFTIPMMKKAGYSPEDAAAVEATASTGGQLMPPIMGAGAFIMSEFLNISYLEVIKAALIPALLYYGALFCNVHLKARKRKLKGIEGSVPGVVEVLREDGHLLIPLVLIIVMLLKFYTPLKSAFWAILVMIGVCAFRRHTRMGPVAVVNALAEGAEGAVGTAVACAVVGFIVGGSSLTALGLTLSGNILKLSGGLLFPTLALAMFACFLLGMGLPTTANYIVTSTVIVPALVKLGIPGLPAHLFVFYFGIMADISPPVCLASFTAAGIAGGDSTRTAFKALALALSSYLLPYMFIYNPEVLLLRGSFWEVAGVVLAAICGITALAIMVQGWWSRVLPPLLRGSFLLPGILCFSPGWACKAAGAAAFLVLITASLVGSRRIKEA
ncbi:MAG: TRAP transporter permease [Fretibacterium sp.]|nr:TRAP transporter permease [Fretibacterium sp.]